jgi:metal iron transporter
VVVAVAVGRDGINALLVASQVVLSIVLPFVAFPLIYLTSSEVVMRVRVTPPDVIQSETPPVQPSVPALNSPSEEIQEIQEIQEDLGAATIQLEDAPGYCDGIPEVIDYSNGLLLATLSYAIWGVIFIANVYAIVMLCLDVD